MGYKLSKRTISNIQAGVSSTCAKASSSLYGAGKMASSIARSTNINGSYANALSRYINGNLNGLIRATSNLSNQMRDTANKIANASSIFERSNNGVIDENAINAMCAKISSLGQDTGALQNEINSALRAASKYIPTTPVSLNSVASGYQKVINSLKKIVRDLHTLNTNINSYSNQLMGGIDYVKSLFAQPSFNLSPSGIKIQVGGAVLSINPKDLSNSSLKIDGYGAHFNFDKSGLRVSYKDAYFNINEKKEVSFDTGNVHLYSTKEALKWLGQDPDDAWHKQWMASNNNVDFRISGNYSKDSKSITFINGVGANAQEHLNQKLTIGDKKDKTTFFGGIDKVSGRKTDDKNYINGYHVVNSHTGVSSKNGIDFEYEHVGKFGEQKHGPYDIFNGKPYSLIGWYDSQKHSGNNGGGGGVF